MTVTDEDLEDLLPDDLSSKGSVGKGRAAPLKRTKKQIAKQREQTAKEIERSERETEELREKAAAQQLAQIVNLHIAGISLAEIGAKIGMTADEVDRLLQRDAQRYVRSQPALRIYVRNMISKGYADMLAVDMPIATDPNHEQMLEHQDRAIKLLDRMARLHGAEAPVQTEVKVEQAPEQIDRIVQALAAQGGRAYDPTIFDDDIVDAEVLVEETDRALEASAHAVEDSDGDDEF